MGRVLKIIHHELISRSALELGQNFTSLPLCLFLSIIAPFTFLLQPARTTGTQPLRNSFVSNHLGAVHLRCSAASSMAGKANGAESLLSSVIVRIQHKSGFNLKCLQIGLTTRQIGLISISC